MRTYFSLILFVLFFFYNQQNHANSLDQEKFRFIVQYEVTASLSIEKFSNKFLTELVKFNIPKNAFEKTLRHIGRIKFIKSDLIEGLYNRLTKTLLLSDTLYDFNENNLKSFETTDPGSLGFLFHELWHVYLSKIAKEDNYNFYATWKSGADNLYEDHGRDFHDEAYALYIEHVMSTYIMIRKLLLPKDTEGKKRLLASTSLEKLYKTAFNTPISGYYFSWKKIFIYSTVNLPDSDRDNILINFFENKFSKELKEDFSDF